MNTLPALSVVVVGPEKKASNPPLKGPKSRGAQSGG